MGLNVFVHTEETRRKRQRNWQATRNLQLLQSRHAVNQLPVSRNFLPAYPSLPTPFYSRFSSSEELLVVSMALHILAFQKDWLVVLFHCLHNIFYWEGANTKGIIISKKCNYSHNISVKILWCISVYAVILSCWKLELIQYKHFSKLATVDKPLSFKQL